MNHSNQQGSIGFRIEADGPDPEWWASDRPHVWAPFKLGAADVFVEKESDRTLNVLLCGPFEQTVKFRVQTPRPKGVGIEVQVVWFARRVVLMLDGESVAMQQVS